jgi:uncharacterized membrane protein YeaQ/YmgE (transglycosylase-associated protein family)
MPTPPANDSPPLRVRAMRVIWRDTFLISPEGNNRAFLADCRARLEACPPVVARSGEERGQQPELLRVVERVSRSVASLAHTDLLRAQFASIQVANLRPTLARYRRAPQHLTADQVREAAAQADAEGAWYTVMPVLLVHRARVGLMSYFAAFDRPAGGLSPDEAIELVRMGISAQLIRLPGSWRAALPADPAAAHLDHLLDESPGQSLAVTGLRDLTQYAVAPVLSTPDAAAQERPTGSASVVLLDCDPAPGDDLEAFIGEHGVPLRGIGAMDSFYQERASWLVERELRDNLSADSEAAVYLLGNSELILFNHQTPDIVAHTARRHNLSDEHAATYLYMHYGVLLEWLYIQDAILRDYLHRLDALAADPRPRRRDVITALQGALADMVQYQEHITPYATRVEFLERARAYHKIDALTETFERKQDLLLSYMSEYHDYRDARATVFLNWLVGILTGAELANLLAAAFGISPQTNRWLFVGVTLGSIALVFVIMVFLLRRSRR